VTGCDRKGRNYQRQNSVIILNYMGKNGRSGGIRTHDPYTPSIVRYQAALRSGRGPVIPARHAIRNRLFTLSRFVRNICLPTKAGYIRARSTASRDCTSANMVPASASGRAAGDAP
jgi:hypothetical protein